MSWRSIRRSVGCVEALRQVEGWPCAHAAVAVCRRASRPSVGDVDHVFDWASRDQARDRCRRARRRRGGDRRLDEPAGPPGSTVRHLLAHASGLPFEEPAADRRSRDAADLLERRLRARWPRSSARGAAMPFPGVLRGGLGLPARRVAGLRRVEAPLATLVAVARELARAARISARTLAEAASVQFPGLDGVLPGFGRYEPNDWGLGFELRDGKAAPLDGRAQLAGDASGTSAVAGTFLWVDPERGLALACLTDRRVRRLGQGRLAAPRRRGAGRSRRRARRLALPAALAAARTGTSPPQTTAERPRRCRSPLGARLPRCGDLAVASSRAQSERALERALRQRSDRRRRAARRSRTASSSGSTRRRKRCARPCSWSMLTLTSLTIVLVGDPVEHRCDGVARARTTRPRSRRSPCPPPRAPRSRTSLSLASTPSDLRPFEGCLLTTRGGGPFFPPRIGVMFEPLPDQPDSNALELERARRAGSAREPSRRCGSVTAAARGGRSSTGRSPPTRSSPSTRPGGGR